MSTAELLVLLDESTTLTAEIATDLDALIALVQDNPEVDPAVAVKVAELKAKLVEAAAKFTPTP